MMRWVLSPVVRYPAQTMHGSHPISLDGRAVSVTKASLYNVYCPLYISLSRILGIDSSICDFFIDQ